MRRGRREMDAAVRAWRVDVRQRRCAGLACYHMPVQDHWSFVLGACSAPGIYLPFFFFFSEKFPSSLSEFFIPGVNLELFYCTTFSFLRQSRVAHAGLELS